jgi:hypothetical protein
MTVRIFPSKNDVGATGEGKIGNEDNVSGISGAPWRRNFIVSGLSYRSFDGLDVSIHPGEAIISGYRFFTLGDGFPEKLTFTVNASETDAVWYMKLAKTGGLVTGIEWVRVLSPALDGSDDPADSIPIIQVTSDTTTITELQWGHRAGKGYIYGEYTGNGSTSTPLTISLGQFRPFIVVVAGANATRAKILGISAMLDEAPAVGGADIFGVYFEDCPTSGLDVALADWTVVDKVPGLYSAKATEEAAVTFSFRVRSDGSDANLNESGIVYSYLALAA